MYYFMIFGEKEFVFTCNQLILICDILYKKAFVSKLKSIWSEDDKNNFVLNIKAVKILHQALHENVYAKISKCSDANDILNTLDSIYLTNQFCENVDESLQIENPLNH